jgi:hypothetical protein
LAGLPPRSSAVEEAASPAAVRLWSELVLQLHQAPDPCAVGTEVGLDVGGRHLNGGQVDAKQLRAPLQRRRDRPAQVRVAPSPHRGRLSNWCSGRNRECYRLRPDGTAEHTGDWSRLWSQRSSLARRAADGQQPTTVGINTTLREGDRSSKRQGGGSVVHLPLSIDPSRSITLRCTRREWLVGSDTEGVMELSRFRGHVGYAAGAGDGCWCS